MKKYLQKSLELNNYCLDENIQDKLIVFLELLFKWNKVFRLTAIKEIKQAIDLHLMDSLVISPFIKGTHIIDVGSGGGLPGIPLALACPDKTFTLLDSNGKKTRFLREAVMQLKLKNVEIIHSRVELFHPVVGFDSIITRAFGSLSYMMDLMQHLLNTDGQLLAMKGIRPDDELANLTDNINAEVHQVTIVGINVSRHLVSLKK